jgi:hypothetical protein
MKEQVFFIVLLGSSFVLSEECLDGYTKICIQKNYEKFIPDPQGTLPAIVNVTLTVTVIIIFFKNTYRRNSAMIIIENRCTNIQLYKQVLLFYFLQWSLLNGITVGPTLTDPINQVIIITGYISYKKYAIERH